MDVRHVTKNEFDSEIANSKLPVLVDFWAPWCGPCRMLSPIIEELGDELKGKAKVVKVNVDEEPELAREFGIMSIPTVITFKQGKATSKVVGFRAKEELKDLLLK